MSFWDTSSDIALARFTQSLRGAEPEAGSEPTCRQVQRPGASLCNIRSKMILKKKQDLLKFLLLRLKANGEKRHSEHGIQSNAIIKYQQGGGRIL